MKYKDYYISYTKDCEENKNGYFCQVYIDKQQEYEIDNFCIHKEELEKCSVNENIIKYIDENYHLLNELKEKEVIKMENRYEKELKNKHYLAVALYDEFSFWQESMAQHDQEYFNLSEEEIWETIDKTIDDQQFTEEMWNCFDYYLNHNRKESE